MRRAVSVIVLGVCAIVFCASFVVNRNPIPAQDIRVAVDKLFHFSTIGFVHPRMDGAHADLFACVAAGKRLNDAQSIRYRRAYQAFLLSQQKLFSRLDEDLQIRQDHQMQEPNNIGELGIAGKHDHHDSSAVANFVDLVGASDELRQSSAMHRAWLANGMYKDVLDFMVHMGPAVHSVGLIEDDPVPETDSPFGAPFKRYYQAMKRAQNAAINSSEYYGAIEDALTAYASLVGAVQEKVDTHNGMVLTALSGRFLSLQTIAPRLKHAPAFDSTLGNKGDICSA